MKLTDKQSRIILDLEYKSPAQFLFHFPNRYDISENKAYDDWEIGDKISIKAKLASPFRHVYFARNRAVTNFAIEYDGQIVRVSIFNRPYLKTNHYQDGIIINGTVEKDNKVLAQSVQKVEELPSIVIKPVYSSKQHIRQYEIQRLMRKLLDEITLKDVVPETLQKQRNLMKRSEAMEYIHFPDSKEHLEKALYTIKYEEFLMYHLKNLYSESFNKEGISRNIKENSHIKDLPFKLREDQVLAYKEISEDLNSNHKMNRLLQGDVGSGKTIVAFLLALAMMDASYQVAFMVPTDLLLHQHANNFKELFPNIEFAILNQNSDESVYEKLKNNEVKFVIGTHSLFQDRCEFANLGMVIIDEQHRFGVKQRNQLINKGKDVDVLMLSATPIPQTLAHSLFLNLDVSTLNHSRENKVDTYYVKENSIQSIQKNLENSLRNKEQIYVVCPAIEEGEREGIKNVEEIHYHLSREFSMFNVTMLHGRMNAEEKAAILNDFSSGKIDVLVSTSVIEVGIDVHNANTIVIYNAEQFGLATLHQMRGRVGRGTERGSCYLLSSKDNEENIERLEALVKYDDGFKLSEIDLKQRGMGDLLGLRQSGLPQFYLANIFDDIEILETSKKDAEYLIENLDEFTALKAHVEKLVENKIKENSQ